MKTPFHPKRTPKEIEEIEFSMSYELYMALYHEGMLDSQQLKDTEDETSLGNSRRR